MKISELITALQTALQEHGDLDCTTTDTDYGGFNELSRMEVANTRGVVHLNIEGDSYMPGFVLDQQEES